MSDMASSSGNTLRIGAVNYLNSKPLIQGLDRLGPGVNLLLDLPSRLADSLAAGRLDVALIPSIEFFRNPQYQIVSDACIACRGPVLSVKLLFRVPPTEVRRLALDEGSRTSGALAQILLNELCGVSPELETLPIGADAADTDADAVLLIGDRAIRYGGDQFVEVWDLGERWYDWTAEPFVFAMWVARAGTPTADLGTVLADARNRGLTELEPIARREANILDIDAGLARRYLCENLHFTLGEAERRSLSRFYRLCAERGLAPAGLESLINKQYADGCILH